MSNSKIKQQVLFFILLVILQIPLLHNWVLFGVAFPFPYVGFLLLIPLNISRNWTMVVGFFLGLIVDVFSNTPGVHASASVLVTFVRLPWFGVLADLSDEEFDLSISYLGTLRFTFVIFPLILLHHLAIFTLENEGFSGFWHLISKVFWSSIFSFILVLLAVMAVVPRKRRI